MQAEELEEVEEEADESEEASRPPPSRASRASTSSSAGAALKDKIMSLTEKFTTILTGSGPTSVAKYTELQDEWVEMVNEVEAQVGADRTFFS